MKGLLYYFLLQACVTTWWSLFFYHAELFLFADLMPEYPEFWGNWWMKWFSCYPLYLKSWSSPLKFSLTGNGENEPPVLKREKRKTWETHRLVSVTFLFPSKIRKLILLEIMLRACGNLRVVWWEMTCTLLRVNCT